jgi:two-component system response regulator ResD
LTKEGFDVKDAQNGTEGLALIRDYSFDVILLDIMMPDMDGWQVCRKIRETRQTPILMLTARSDTKDKVQGLGIGADDYLVKPFEPEELIARVFALIRRSAQVQAATPVPRIQFPELVVYPEGRQVIIHEQAVEFTQKEFDLLLALAQHPQRAFTRDSLVEILWGPDYTGDSRVVDTHIKNIREKTQRAGLSYNPIQTVWGVGYKWDVSVGASR